VLGIVTSVVATLVSTTFSATLLARWWRRGRRDHPLLLWGVALALFGLASAALALGVTLGWTPARFRAFYLLGGVLNVPWLALGSIAVNARSPLASRWTGGALAAVAALVGRQVLLADDPSLWLPTVLLATAWGLALLVGRPALVVGLATATLVVASAVATVVVLTAETVAPLAVTGLPEGRDLFVPAVRGHAVAGNVVGAITVVVSALASSASVVWRRPDRAADRELVGDVRREGYVGAVARWVWRGRSGRGPALAHLVRGNLLIAVGVGIAAAGGVLSFLGDTAGHAVGFTVGVVVMYAGFLRTTRPLAPPPHVVLYGRSGCAPCRDAERRALREVGRRARFEVVDVDGAGLADRYGERVPVVVVDGTEVSELGLERGVVRAAVRAAARRSERAAIAARDGGGTGSAPVGIAPNGDARASGG
jgi:hypothetical protein